MVKKRRIEQEAQNEREEEKQLYKQNVQKLKQVKNRWFSKKEELMKDYELIEGIKFLESEEKHFQICDGHHWAVYFCSDGKFKMQRWGMYMGSDYIRPITLDNIDFIDEKKIKKVVKMDFKKELKKQLLQLGCKKRLMVE